MLRRGVAASRRFDLLKVGFIAFAMILVAEFTLVLLLRGISIAEYFAERDPVAGTVYYIMLMAFALMPLFRCEGASEGNSHKQTVQEHPCGVGEPGSYSADSES